MLQDSLCGSSKVMLVCNLSPEAASAGETLSSLNFASRAAQVCPSHDQLLGFCANCLLPSLMSKQPVDSKYLAERSYSP